MPNVIDAVSTVNRRNSKYPWDEWTDGQARQFVAGEDFHCTPISFRQNAYVAAKERGLKLNSSVGKDDNEGIVELQFVPKFADEEPDYAAEQARLDAEDEALTA